MPNIEDFMKFEFKVAKILSVETHPNADRLYVLQIDLGDEKRQLVAGIRKSYSEEELIGKSIVIVANLEPAEIRGQRSEGMLMAASTPNGPVLVTPEKDAPLGAVIK